MPDTDKWTCFCSNLHRLCRSAYSCSYQWLVISHSLIQLLLRGVFLSSSIWFNHCTAYFSHFFFFFFTKPPYKITSISTAFYNLKAWKIKRSPCHCLVLFSGIYRRVLVLFSVPGGLLVFPSHIQTYPVMAIIFVTTLFPQTGRHRFHLAQENGCMNLFLLRAWRNCDVVI